MDKTLELDYITATPRLRLYMKYSTDIYNIYQKYISKDDILVYSIDEVFCDITTYLKLYKLTPEELVTKMIMVLRGMKMISIKTKITIIKLILIHK